MCKGFVFRSILINGANVTISLHDMNAFFLIFSLIYGATFTKKKSRMQLLKRNNVAIFITSVERKHFSNPRRVIKK